MRREYAKEGLLPSEYRQLEYIESTGTQCIDTGVLVDNTFSIDIEAYFRRSINQQRLISAGDLSLAAAKYGVFDIYENVNGRYSFSWADNSEWKSTSIQVSAYNTYFSFKWDIPNRIASISLNGSSLYNGTATPFRRYSQTGTLYLFCRHYNNDCYSYTRIKSCVIMKAGNIVRSLIPALRTSDNKPGLYDTVNNVFYTNQGTGEFLYA